MVGTTSPIAQILSDPEDDLTLRAALYGVLFQAYADQGEWEEALAAMDKSITDMPRTKHRLLIFKHRLMVKAKLGRDVHVDIAKFKDESEDYLALMWHKVAMCSKDQLEQLASYQNAIEALQSSATDWQKVEYLIEFSEWLYLNEFPLQDCVDQLEWAVDILLNMKIQTRVKIDQGSAKSSRRRRGRKSAKAQDSQHQGPTTASPAPTETKSAIKEGDVTDPSNEANIIPVKKESVIGLSVSNINLTAGELTSIRQLEHLVRVHVMLAIMTGRGSPGHNSYCLMAWGFLQRIWQVSLRSGGIVAKELAKAAAAVDQTTSKHGSAKAKKGKDKGKETETPRDKPKRKGPLDAVPANAEEWASYDVPDEIREAFKEDNTGEGINSSTILKPSLTLYYLEMLVKELRSIGYNHMIFPALNLGEVIARDMLKSNVAGNTYRLIAADVCLELNLSMAAKFHEATAGPPGLIVEDQARCREEISQYKERQSQVRKEAERTKELQTQMAGNKNLKKAKQSTRNLIPADQKMDIKESVRGLSKSLSAMTYRQAWTEQAQILIKQGFYQAARELLNEAFLAAKAFEDQHTEAHIIQSLACLAYQEGNYGLAVSMLKQAQKLEGDEEFWLTTTLLLVDATLGEVEDKERNNKARAILMRALSTYNDLVGQRPNKKGLLTYIRASLDAKFASVQVSHVLEESKDTMKPKAHRELQTACQRFEHSAKDLALCGYTREAVQILQQHCSVLRLFAADSKEKELQHSFLLQAQSVLRDALNMMEQLQNQVQTATDMLEIRNLSIPIQRELCALKTTYAELLIDMFAVYADEQRHQQLQEARKGSVEKLVENFISSTPVLTDVDKEWEEVASTFASSALVQLESAHNIAGTIVPLKAKCLYNIGRCLRMMGSHQAPSPPSQWDIQYMHISNGDGNPDKDAGEGEEEEQELEMSEIQLSKYNKMATKLQDCQSASEVHLAQATEVLGQSVQLGLQVSDRKLVAAACLELVECCGQFDQALASQYLALYQSCLSAKSLEDVLYRAQQDPTTSCQATLLQQRQLKNRNGVSSNWPSSDLAKAVNSSLQENSEAWRRLAISPEHITLIKELPTNFNIIILQHSEDNSVLYGSILDRAKTSTGKEGGKSKGGAVPVSRAKVTRTAVDPQILENLYRKFRQYKQDVTQALLKAEYRRSQQVQRQKMLENLSDEMKQDIQETSGDDVDMTEERLQEQFLSLVTAMEDYLKPITSYLESSIRTIEALPPVHTSRDVPASPPDECIIILADKWLMEMPLEALSIFSSPNLASITRDFSLQMLYNRVHREPEEEMTEEKKKKEAAKQKAAKEKAKGVKMVPIERPVPSGCLPVDTHSFKYIVDSYDDCGDEATPSPMFVMNEALKLYQTQFTARWEGLVGKDHVPSIGEWEQYMNECQAFIFYGLEKLFSYLPPSKVAPMNLAEMELFILLDLVQTNDSFMRQARINVHKSVNDLSLEKPIETAMLLSLSGVNCVLANQWHCTLQDNAGIFNVLLKGLLEVGRTTGQTVRRLFIPYWKPEGEEEAEGEGDGEEKDAHNRATTESKSGKAKDGGKGGKDKPKSAKSGKVRKESHGSQVKGDQGKEKGAVAKEGKDSGAEDAAAPVEMNRHWFNYVCYGLPNLMVTQI